MAAVVLQYMPSLGAAQPGQPWIGEIMGTKHAYLSLQGSHKQRFQSLASLVTVADIFESLGCVLSGNVQQDLFTTAAETEYYQYIGRHKHAICRGEKSFGAIRQRQVGTTYGCSSTNFAQS